MPDERVAVARRLHWLVHIRSDCALAYVWDEKQGADEGPSDGSDRPWGRPRVARLHSSNFSGEIFLLPGFACRARVERGPRAVRFERAPDPVARVTHVLEAGRLEHEASPTLVLPDRQTSP